MVGEEHNWRVIVVGGHTRSIGKTQLVCDLVAALPTAQWIAGKITQYGHGVCAENGENCDCAPDEHICAISWEKSSDTGTDSARFLAAGARRAFWLRTKQGFLAEGMPLLREALQEVEDDVASTATPRSLILESNTLMQFWKPQLYLMVVNPVKGDFKESARLQLDRVSAFVLRDVMPELTDATKVAAWAEIPLQLLRGKPNFLQRDREALPGGLVDLVRNALVGTDAAGMHRART